MFLFQSSFSQRDVYPKDSTVVCVMIPGNYMSQRTTVESFHNIVKVVNANKDFVL